MPHVDQLSDKAEQKRQRRERRWVGLAIAAAALLFLGCVSLLFYRYSTVHEPSSSLRVLADSSLTGGIVSVQSRGSRRLLEVRLVPRLGYSARFYLDPGTYDLSVITAQGDVICAESVDLYAGHPVIIDLRKLKPDTRPS